MLITQGSLVRAQLDPPNSDGQRTAAQVAEMWTTGGLAQLGEHLLCKQGVVGSIPSSSTNNNEVRSESEGHQTVTQHQSGFDWKRLKAVLLLINID